MRRALATLPPEKKQRSPEALASVGTVISDRELVSDGKECAFFSRAETDVFAENFGDFSFGAGPMPGPKPRNGVVEVFEHEVSHRLSVICDAQMGGFTRVDRVRAAP